MQVPPAAPSPGHGAPPPSMPGGPQHGTQMMSAFVAHPMAPPAPVPPQRSSPPFSNQPAGAYGYPPPVPGMGAPAHDGYPPVPGPLTGPLSPPAVPPHGGMPGSPTYQVAPPLASQPHPAQSEAVPNSRDPLRGHAPVARPRSKTLPIPVPAPTPQPQPPAPAAATPAPSPTPRPSPSPPAERRLLVGFLVTYQSDPTGAFWPLRSGRTPIGRADGDAASEIAVHDASMSSRHAVTIGDPETGQVFIEDDGSRNGTFVNEQRVSTGERRMLRDGDRLRLGSTTFVVKLLVA